MKRNRKTITAIFALPAFFVVSAFAQAPSSTGKQTGLTNPGFEEPRGKEASFVFAATMPGWKTTDKEFEIWSTGFQKVAAHEGTQFVELNAWIDGTLYQDSKGIQAGSVLEFTFAHRGRTGKDSMKLTITDLGADNSLGGGDDTVLFTKEYSTGKDAWAVYDSTKEKQIKALGNTVRFAYGAIKTATGEIGAGNFLDAANFGIGVVSMPQAASGIKAGSWEIHQGGPPLAFNTADKSGMVSALDKATIPPQKDPGWKQTSDATVNVQEKSAITTKDKTKVDYTFFQVMVTVPQGAKIQNLQVKFDQVDDAARVWIFNSKHPKGKYFPDADVLAGGQNLTVSANFKDEVAEGENRIVITQYDNYPVLNIIKGIHLIVDGQEVKLSTLPQKQAIPVPHYGKVLSSQEIKFVLPKDPAIEQVKQWGLLAKDKNTAKFVTVVRGAVMETVLMGDGNTYTRPTFEAIIAPGNEGEPTNPSSSTLIQVDPAFNYKVVVDEVSWYDHPGKVDLAPTQAPLPDVKTPDGQEPETLFAKDASKYLIDRFNNVQPITIGERINVQGKEFLKVLFRPVSYNPAQRALRLSNVIKWHIDILPPDKPRQKSATPPGPAKNGVLDIRVSDSGKPGPDGSAPVEPKKGNPAAGAKPSAIAGIAATAAEAQYLIITPDRFLDEIEPLALWKHQKGFKTYVATLQEVGGSTEDAIKKYITTATKDRDKTAPTYVLLVGDDEELPMAKIVGHPYHDPYDLGSKRRAETGQVVVEKIDEKIHVRIIDKTGTILVDKGEKDLVAGTALESLRTLLAPSLPGDLPRDNKWSIINDAKAASGYDGDVKPHIWGSDHPYSLVDGDDNYPDVYVGRFSADTEDEVTVMVKKTMTYDRAPSSGDWYKNVLLAGQFQDHDNNVRDKIDDRMFMEDLHRVGDFLGADYDFFDDPKIADKFNKGFTIKTALVWDENEDEPGIEYKGWSYGGRIAPPTVVPKTWRNFGKGGAVEVAAAIKEGVSIILHRDHGYSGGEGWADPRFEADNVKELKNFQGDKGEELKKERLPFVFSLNCATGWSDGLDSFAESWLRNDKGGAVGFLGASRVSFSGYNDCFHVGLFDTFWNDYSDYDKTVVNDVVSGEIDILYNNSWRPAEAMVRAKAFVLSSFTDTKATLTAQLYSWHGDPELSLRTEAPEPLKVSPLASLAAGENSSFTVNVTRKGRPCEGALVAITMAPGDHHVALADKLGNAAFSFAPSQSGTMKVVTTERNSIPYFGEIKVGAPAGAPSGTLTFEWSGEVGNDASVPLTPNGEAIGNTGWMLNGNALPVKTVLKFTYTIPAAAKDTDGTPSAGRYTGGTLNVSIPSKGVNSTPAKAYDLIFGTDGSSDFVLVQPSDNTGFALVGNWPATADPWPNPNVLSPIANPKARNIFGTSPDGKFTLTLKSGHVVTTAFTELLANSVFSSSSSARPQPTPINKTPPKNAMKLDVAGGAFTFGYSTKAKPGFTEFDNTDSPFPNDKNIKRRNIKNGDPWFSFAQNTAATAADPANTAKVFYPAKDEGSGVLHPGSNADDVAKARFTAPDNGEYGFEITAKLIADNPTGAGVTIYVDGKVVDDSYKTYLNKHQDPWIKSSKHTLTKGQTVDIAVDNGANSYSRDHVLVTAKAWKVAP